MCSFTVEVSFLLLPEDVLLTTFSRLPASSTSCLSAIFYNISLVSPSTLISISSINIKSSTYTSLSIFNTQSYFYSLHRRSRTCRSHRFSMGYQDGLCPAPPKFISYRRSRASPSARKGSDGTSANRRGRHASVSGSRRVGSKRRYACRPSRYPGGTRTSDRHVDSGASDRYDPIEEGVEGD